MSEFLALDLPELHRRLDAHQAERPTDLFSSEMQVWLVKKGRIAFAIELKEAEARQQPFTITVPPQPIERPVQPLLRLRKAKSSTQEEVRHADSPGNAGAPGARSAPEAPMPKIALNSPDPSARIAHLLGLIQKATKKGEKLYWAQQEVRKICEARGLDIPLEAQRTRFGANLGRPTKQGAPPPSVAGQACAGGRRAA